MSFSPDSPLQSPSYGVDLWWGRGPINRYNCESLQLYQRSLEKQNQQDIYTEREIYFKELAHAVVEAGKSKICRLDQQAGGLGKSYSLSLKASCWQKSLSINGGPSFF